MRTKSVSKVVSVVKTKDEILNQLYMSATDLKQLMPTLGMNLCRKIINEVQVTMKEKNYFVPDTQPKLALTKEVRKKMGF